MSGQMTKKGRQSRVQIEFGRNGRSSRIVSGTMNDALSGKWHLPVIRRRKRGVSYPPYMADAKRETPNERNAGLKYREWNEEKRTWMCRVYML